MFNTWNKHVFRQTLAVIIFTCKSMLGGAALNFSGTLLAQLQEEDSSLKITRSEATWIASISSIGTMIGTIASVCHLEIFGRRWSYLLISLSSMFCWGLLTLSTQVWHLYLGRILLGFSNGLSSSIHYIFLVEVVELKYRNFAINIANAGTTLGILFVDAMGSYLKWQITAYVLSGVCAICVVVLLYLQNTHVPYLQKGETDKAVKQFFWYRSNTPESWKEFNSDKNVASVKVSFAKIKDEWKRKEFLIPLGILFWFITTVELNGSTGIMLYSVDIMRHVVSIDKYLTVIISDVLGIIASFGTLIVLEFISVRMLLNLSSIICSSALLTISVSLYLVDGWSGWSTVTVAAIWIFKFCCKLGYTNIIYVLFGTFFTGVGKSAAMGLTALYLHSMIFAMGHLLPVLFDKLDYSGSFLFFGGCTIVGGVGVYFIVPETKGKTSEEVRMIFHHYRLSNITKGKLEENKEEYLSTNNSYCKP